MIDTAMDESTNIFTAMVQRIFEDHNGEFEGSDAGHWPTSTWSAILELGLPLALLDEADGGFGLTPSNALAAVRIAGSFALNLPLAEAMLAPWILSQSGIELPQGLLTIAPQLGSMTLARAGSTLTLRGTAPRVPSARNVDWIVLQARDGDNVTTVVIARAAVRIIPEQNLADEARDDIEVDISLDVPQVGTIGAISSEQWLSLGAVMRCQSMAGAAERVLAMTIQYAQDRKQFGKSLGAFQAIQHNLAIAAGQVVAMRGAADMAADAFGTSDILPIAAAKARCGEAAGNLAAIAHQIHGALGFTREHSLHRFTRRLWAWREEYGNEVEWQMMLGRAAIGSGGEGIWPLLTRIS
jgi:acyl-CoA dehydrogenase